MSTTQNIKHFLSITPFLIGAWDRVRNQLPSHSSDTPPPSPTVDLESQSPGNQPLHSDTILPMLQPALQPLHPSNTPTTSTAIDLESQLPETQAQPSLTLNQEIPQTSETQPLHFRANNAEILLQAAQTEAPQPHSAIEMEQQLLPPTQQTAPPAIIPQQINTVTVNQITLEWPNIIMAFCFEAAIQIAIQYVTTRHSKLRIPLNLLSVSIALTFASLFVSQLISKKLPDISKVLEKVAIFLAVISFVTAIATPLALNLN